MSVNNSEQAKPIYKYFRGKWKELGVDNKDNFPIEEKEHCIKDLEKKSVIELEELIFRQEKLLSNKTFISKLKDKGSKLQQKLEELQNVLKVVKENSEKANEEKKNFPDIHSIEWHGDNENNKNNNTKNSRHNNDDDDESNPLQLLARHSMDYPEKIYTRKFRDEDENAAELIAKELEKLNIEDAKADDLDDVDDLTRNKSSTNYFGKKFINLESSSRPKSHKERFRTNRSLKENVKSSEKSVKSIPIAESLKLMAEAHNKERGKVYSEAAGALQQSTLMGMTLPASNCLAYRDANTTQHLLEEYEEDINDFMYSGFSEKEEDEDENNEY